MKIINLISIYRGIDKDTNKYVWRLDSLKIKNNIFDRISAKTILDNMTKYSYLYNSNEMYSFINLVLKYNEKFR